MELQHMVIVLMFISVFEFFVLLFIAPMAYKEYMQRDLKANVESLQNEISNIKEILEKQEKEKSKKEKASPEQIKLCRELIENNKWDFSTKTLRKIKELDRVAFLNLLLALRKVLENVYHINDTESLQLNEVKEIQRVVFLSLELFDELEIFKHESLEKLRVEFLNSLEKLNKEEFKGE